MGSVVYFIESFDGFIKIGWTSDLARRLVNLNAASSQPLRVLVTTPGGKTLEAHLHERFAHARGHGEWFQPIDDLKHLIKQISDGRTDIFAGGLAGADDDKEVGLLYAGSRSEQATVFARRLVDLGVERGLSVRHSISQVVSRLRVQSGTFTALLYRAPSSVDVDLYFRLRELLSEDLTQRLGSLETELVAVRRARSVPFSQEDLQFFDDEVARLRKRISEFREGSGTFPSVGEDDI